MASVQYVHDVCIKIDLQMADGLDYDDDDEVPTEEMVERMEERLELVQNQQKRLFLIIFQVSHSLGEVKFTLKILKLGQLK